MKKSKFYNLVYDVLNGVDIETMDIGTSSKRILRKILEIVNNEEDSEIKNKLLKTHKLNLRIASDLILESKMKKKW